MAHNGKLPSTAELERYVKDKEPLRFCTMDGKEHLGVLRWFDDYSFSFVDDKSQKNFTLLRHAVLGYGPSKK